MTPRHVKVTFVNAEQAAEQLGALTARIQGVVAYVEETIRAHARNTELVNALLDVRLVLTTPQEDLIP